MTTQSWPPGAVLTNRYQILCPLGHGEMGTLYLARDLRFARWLAVLNKDPVILNRSAAEVKNLPLDRRLPRQRMRNR